jgi:hypothetical protein
VALNLKTGNAVSTGKDGQPVIGHPAGRYLFTAADQGAHARTLLLDVVHVDVGQTELSLLSLRLLTVSPSPPDWIERILPRVISPPRCFPPSA